MLIRTLEDGDNISFPDVDMLILLIVETVTNLCLNISKQLRISKKQETSGKWLTVAIFQKWQDSSVALWIDIAVIL